MGAAEETLGEISQASRELMAFNKLRTEINTSMPAVVRAVRGNTVDVEIPVLRIITSGGKLRPLEIDMVPVVYPGAGRWTLKFPIAKGDSGLLVFAQRDCDSWFASGEETVPGTGRMHDYSDGIFIPGLRPDPDAHKVPDSLQVEGPQGVAIDVAEDGTVTLTAGAASLTMEPSGAITLDGSAITATGSAAVSLSAPSATLDGTATATVSGAAVTVAGKATTAVTGGAVSVTGAASASLAGPAGGITAGAAGAPVIASAAGGDLGSLVLALADTLAASAVPSGPSAGPLSSAGAAAAIAAQLRALQGG